MTVNEFLPFFDNQTITELELDFVNELLKDVPVDTNSDNRAFNEAYACIKLRVSKVGTLKPDYTFIENYAKTKGFIVYQVVKDYGIKSDTWITTCFTV